LHLVAVSIWVGGLFAFLLQMRQVGQFKPLLRTQMTGLLIPRFTTLAITSVSILVLTGVYASILRVSSFDALWTTSYGQALIAKLVVAAIMLMLGAINLLYTSPNMVKAARQPEGNPGLVRRFNYLLAGEVFLGIGVLVWVGVLTGIPTTRSTALSAVYQKSVQADDLGVNLSIDPGRPGLNTFIVTLKSGAKEITDANDVALEFSSLTGSIPPAKAAMTNLGDGRYSLTGGYLAFADRWDIKVVVIRSGKFDAYADFKVDWSAKP
jgi:copper transport protein